MILSILFMTSDTRDLLTFPFCYFTAEHNYLYSNTTLLKVLQFLTKT